MDITGTDSSTVQKYKLMPVEDKRLVYQFTALSCIEDRASENGKPLPSDNLTLKLLHLSLNSWLASEGHEGIDRFADVISDAYFKGVKTIDDLCSMKKYELLDYVSDYDYCQCEQLHVIGEKSKSA